MKYESIEVDPIYTNNSKTWYMNGVKSWYLNGPNILKMNGY